MALQGTIDSFPLVDVLQLLTTSNKTGRLDLVGDRGRGALWVDEGRLIAGNLQGRDLDEAADAVWELLRFNDGSFEFSTGEEPLEARFSTDVGEAMAAASEMLEQWERIVERVPDLAHHVQLSTELPGADIRLSADDWSAVVAIGPGPRVQDVLVSLGASEFAGCARLAELVDRGLIEVTEPAAGVAAQPAVAPVEVEPAAPLPDPAEPVAAEPVADETVPVESEFREPAAAEPVADAPDAPAPLATEPVAAEPADAAVPQAAPQWDAPEDVPLSEQFPEQSVAQAEVPAAASVAPPQPAPEPMAPGVAEPVLEARVVSEQEPAPGEHLAQAEAVVAQGLPTQPQYEAEPVAGAAGEFPEHFPIDDLVGGERNPAWDPAQQAADQPAATGGHNGADPQADAASGDVLSQISRLSPKAAEAIAAALGDGEAQ